MGSIRFRAASDGGDCRPTNPTKPTHVPGGAISYARCTQHIALRYWTWFIQISQQVVPTKQVHMNRYYQPVFPAAKCDGGRAKGTEGVLERIQTTIGSG